IPISQKTIEVCEELDIDPYQIGAGGCILMITRDAEKLLSALYAEGAEAADIGCLQNGFAKELHNGDEVRCLEPYRG
ncbi:MAG: hydrogenase maturation factor, partial [Lachnospiraceae bacterium]|nr:hydrogenase maturation factor [Lachnospiraceae bacterium]